MVLDIKVCKLCEAGSWAVRQLVVDKTNRSVGGPENVWSVYIRLINSRNSPLQKPLA
jgi:hypothetical protein